MPPGTSLRPSNPHAIIKSETPNLSYLPLNTQLPTLRPGTDNQEKDEKQSQNDKTGLGMEKIVKDKAKSKPESQSSQKVNRKVNWSKSKSTPKKYKFRD
ncbi:hypothetical protein Tco_1262109 [Tanacetum coccineum]